MSDAPQDDTAEMVVFLRARLDEDERIALAMQERMDALRLRPKHLSEPWPELEVHIARHDPARVLREVEAKRRTLKLYERSLREYGDVFRGGPIRREYTHGIVEGLKEAVKDLASVHSDHPDYREEWRP